jgi:hypothetical protein
MIPPTHMPVEEREVDLGKPLDREEGLAANLKDSENIILERANCQLRCRHEIRRRLRSAC